MTSGEVGALQEGAGQLGPTPLPVGAVNLSVAEILANLDVVILTRERDLGDDLVLIQMTLRHPEIRTRRYEGREKDEENVISHTLMSMVNLILFD